MGAGTVNPTTLQCLCGCEMIYSEIQSFLAHDAVEPPTDRSRSLRTSAANGRLEVCEGTRVANGSGSGAAAAGGPFSSSPDTLRMMGRGGGLEDPTLIFEGHKACWAPLSEALKSYARARTTRACDACSAASESASASWVVCRVCKVHLHRKCVDDPLVLASEDAGAVLCGRCRVASLSLQHAGIHLDVLHESGDDTYAYTRMDEDLPLFPMPFASPALGPALQTPIHPAGREAPPPHVHMSPRRGPRRAAAAPVPAMLLSPPPTERLRRSPAPSPKLLLEHVAPVAPAPLPLGPDGLAAHDESLDGLDNPADTDTGTPPAPAPKPRGRGRLKRRREEAEALGTLNPAPAALPSSDVLESGSCGEQEDAKRGRISVGLGLPIATATPVGETLDVAAAVAPSVDLTAGMYAQNAAISGPISVSLQGKSIGVDLSKGRWRARRTIEGREHFIGWEATRSLAAAMHDK